MAKHMPALMQQSALITTSRIRARIRSAGRCHGKRLRIWISQRMNEAAKRLLGRRDFTSFSKLHTDVKTNICDLRCAEWQQVDDYNYRFVITADRFLRNMVRAVVGTLVDVGRGKITADDVSHILEQKDRCAAGVSMPGEALFLWDIKYDYYTGIKFFLFP